VPASRRWLYGRWPDLLLGGGVAYMLSIPLLWLWATAAGLGAWPATTAALLALFVNAPHYGATILRVYERPEDRRRYGYYAGGATLGLFVLFVLGVHDLWVGSLLYTAYLSWAPWHFAGQNYGLALMFLGRRGVTVDATSKRLLYVSFLLSFALALLVLHVERGGAATPVPVDGTALLYRFLPLGIPDRLVEAVFPIVAGAYLVACAAAAVRLRRSARLVDLLPTICLVLLQALWYALPAAVRMTTGARPEGLAFTVLGISVFHSLQYLWVSSYYARREDPEHRLAPYLLRALLAGLTVGIVPGLVFAPGLLGSVPWNMGLAILLFSVVNLHHFMLDGVIWKLRDGRVARMLLREAVPEDGSPSAPRRARFRPAIAVLGTVSLIVAITDLWQRDLVINRHGNDVERLRSATGWLARIGRDSPNVHNRIALLLAQRGALRTARDELERSLAIHPTSVAWRGIGQLEAREERWSEASEAYTEALALAPDDVATLLAASRAWLALGRIDRARAALEHARTLVPDPIRIDRELARLRRD
jgi:hypothetical protein